MHARRYTAVTGVNDERIEGLAPACYLKAATSSDSDSAGDRVPSK